MKKVKLLIFVFILNLLFLGNVSAANFDCKIGDYTIRYNGKGEIVSAKNTKGKAINKNLSSYFKPKKASQCPTNKNAKVSFIDGGRTLYVAKKDETYSSGNDQKNQDMGSCIGYTKKNSCQNNQYYACIWNETKYGNYCNTDNLLYVACGDSFDIPHQAPELISFAVNLLKIATPIILIFVSVITLFKAITAQKEDEIKKAQSSLIKKIIAAVMVFFIVSIVQFVISKVADSSEQGGIESCLSCFLNNDCKGSLYYKVNIAGDYKCIYVDDKNTLLDCKGDE